VRKQVHLIISGVVQGVLFRSSASNIACSLKLNGFVRNLSNGSVELVAVGEEEFLGRMIDWCRKGPPGARVEDIEIEWNQPIQEFNYFQIR